MNWDILILGLFVLFIVVSLLLKLDYRVAIGVGVMLLVAAPFSIAITEKETMARQFALFSYYFLLSGVIICFVSYLRTR